MLMSMKMPGLQRGCETKVTLDRSDQDLYNYRLFKRLPMMILDSNKVSNPYLMISEINLLFRRFGIETLSRRALNHQEFWSLLKIFRCQAISPEEFPSMWSCCKKIKSSCQNCNQINSCSENFVFNQRKLWIGEWRKRSDQKRISPPLFNTFIGKKFTLI